MPKNPVFESRLIPESVVQAVADRDAALWIGDGICRSPEDVQILARLMGLPWKLVLCESNEEALIEAIEAQNVTQTRLSRRRGFIHLLASDPENTQIPPRALPIFLLNGRQNFRESQESPNIGRMASLRRRLNMINELSVMRPKLVLLVAAGTEQPLSDFFSLWTEEGFRSQVVLLSTAARDLDRMEDWLLQPKAVSAIEHCKSHLADVLPDLIHRLAIEAPEGRLIVRIRNGIGKLSDIDLTDCDLVERPLLDNYELIQAKDIRLLLPRELSRNDIEGFFNRSIKGWRCYAAGLPWNRGDNSAKKLLDSLSNVMKEGPSENRIYSIISESGAGGTTFARMLAFEVATQGYPTLLARPGFSEPQVLELSGFLYRAHLASAAQTEAESSNRVDTITTVEIPWLIVFDVEHWAGKHEELTRFLTALIRDGRSVVILAVSDPFIPVDLSKTSRVRRLASLTYDLSLKDALGLGVHLNKFLRPLGRDRSASEWQQFWEAHRPDYITSSIAHFWIALEFWLKRQLDLNQSIQSWLYKSFRESNIENDLRLLLLEIAALTVERKPLPEGLMPIPEAHRFPYSVLLEDVRVALPSLALVREAVGQQKVWAMAHDLLGRYLINSTFFDHGMLERLNLAQATDPVQLRLNLLRRVACRSALALKPFRKLAIDFAVSILKLDAHGNQEFIPYWREVLSILEAMPTGVRETSRAFNHHVAISLRRVAKRTEFNIPADERKKLLERAICHLEYALYELDIDDDEEFERNINLFNSLALGYQDLADVERELGAGTERIENLRAKATDATRKALEHDPTNSYVLETSAKNLIQNGELHPELAAASASEALGYIYQAVTFERSELRQKELTRLATSALALLRSSQSRVQVQQLIRSNNPLGTLAEAWMLLTDGIADLGQSDLATMPSRNIAAALAVLEGASEKSNWMLLRFRYDLLCASRPLDFAAQLRLLDELDGTGYRMPFQLQLEYAILLHQQGRHLEANRKFRQHRQDIRLLDVTVEVPNRLRWLRVPDGDGRRRICEAQVVETGGHRAVAKVRDLKNEIVPFVPQEFGVEKMRPGDSFKCSISFGFKGPLLRPPLSGGAS